MHSFSKLDPTVNAVLVAALKKQSSHKRRKRVIVASERLNGYCVYSVLYHFVVTLDLVLVLLLFSFYCVLYKPPSSTSLESLMPRRYRRETRQWYFCPFSPASDSSLQKQSLKLPQTSTHFPHKALRTVGIPCTMLLKLQSVQMRA